MLPSLDSHPDFWALVRRQHGAVARSQLRRLGFTSGWIQRRVAGGLFHPAWRGVYAVGRPDLARPGRWMAALLSCGSEAVLSHESAAVLWAIRDRESGLIEVTVPASVAHTRTGIRVHRRVTLRPCDITERDGIPVTSPTRTLVDLGLRLRKGPLEAAINRADKLDLLTPEELEAEAWELRGLAGTPRIRAVVGRASFRLTDSELERRFLAIVRRAGLPEPVTQQWVNGYRVDFYWPDLGLVVETDGLRYHRTANQQAIDRERDQAHTAAGLTALRFTHGQIAYSPRTVAETLATVVRRLTDRTDRTRV